MNSGSSKQNISTNKRIKQIRSNLEDEEDMKTTLSTGK
jgi:hypothetical protein